MTPQNTGGATLVVRLTKKLAEQIDGVSLVGYRVGDLIHLERHEADTLVAEGWAEVVAEQMYIVGLGAERRIASDRSLHSTGAVESVPPASGPAPHGCLPGMAGDP